MQLIMGAGPVGRHIAQLLADSGDDVVLASRSGQGPRIQGARRIALDANDAADVARAAQGASVIYNALNPPAYHKWPQQWPPMEAALRSAAQTSGAVLATVGNLYSYGRVDRPMVEGMPDCATELKGRVRAQMTAAAMAAHRAGDLRFVEVRGSDYAGTGVGEGSHLTRLVPAIRKGKTARVVGAVDQPHSFTDVLDVARAIVTVAGDERGLGRIWHVPTNPARTQAEAVADLCEAAGLPQVAVRPYPAAMFTLLGPIWPQAREINAMRYEFDRPFILDSSAIQAEFGLAPTPWKTVCERTMAG